MDMYCRRFAHTTIAAFTLVELIVVITILAILGTIGFLSLQGYSRSARDSERVSDLVNLSKGFDILAAAGKSFPQPDANMLTITASGTTIGYQGYAGRSVLSALSLGGKFQDPVEAQYYTYSTNLAQNRYQVLGLLEDSGNSSLALNDLGIPGVETAYAGGYDTRYPLSRGASLGILLGTGATLNQPVQELYAAGSFTGVDIVNTGTNYSAYVSQKKVLTGTGANLKVLTANNPKSSVTYAVSCKDINDNGLSQGDGTYYINPTGTGSFQVYCDMTTDGGGWTLVNGTLINNADNKDVILQNTVTVKGGTNISAYPQNVNGCVGSHGTTVFIANVISWKQVRADYKFYGGNSCWGIFGNKYNSSLTADDNIVTFDPLIDTIRNEYRMRNLTVSVFDGVSRRCDNDPDTNFWHSNKGYGEKSASVILRKENLSLPAGLHTDISCLGDNQGWKYENIFVK